MPLHLDFRPKDLDEFIGNEETVNSLKSIFARDDRPRAVLFYGPSGCGKTTLARIFASEVGCPPEVKGEVNPDFQEINASNNRGIDTAREMMSSMQYRPLSGVSRVYLIDEAQQTTKDFQHAILKALEDTPEWVYFILCTTEPERLLPTIRNRCSRFPVNKLSRRSMGKVLNWVMEEEELSIPDEIEKAIIKAADGCPREALVTLDQIVDLDKEDMEEAIRTIEIREQSVIELCQALLRGDSWKKVKEILKGIDEEPEKVRRAVLGYITSVALNDEKGGHIDIYNEFRDPFFHTGKAGLVFACLEAVKE